MGNARKNLSPKVSVIIAVRRINEHIRAHLPKILEQEYPNFEILLHTDQIEPTEKWPKTKIFYEPQVTDPPEKRNALAKRASGSILAFIDDDAYPEENWMRNAIEWFENKEVAGVGGPNLTHPEDTLLQRVSGLVWGSKLGSGGAGLSRVSCVLSARGTYVDDWQSVNLFVRRDDFLKVGGFVSKYYPGEDTKLCLDLVYGLNKKIIYDPEVVVYHHRRPVFREHLKQVRAYGRHRGYFAKIYPKTSRRLGYFLPTAFVLGLVLGWPLGLLHPLLGVTYLFSVSLYLLLLFLSGVDVYLKSENFLAALLVIPSIFLTHIGYGISFIKGLLSRGYSGRSHY